MLVKKQHAMTSTPIMPISTKHLSITYQLLQNHFTKTISPYIKQQLQLQNTDLPTSTLPPPQSIINLNIIHLTITSLPINPNKQLPCKHQLHYNRSTIPKKKLPQIYIL